MHKSAKIRETPRSPPRCYTIMPPARRSAVIRRTVFCTAISVTRFCRISLPMFPGTAITAHRSSGPSARASPPAPPRPPSPPENTCTRGQIVTFLWRAAGSPEPASTENPFRDVSESAYYYKAICWAVENNITNGTDRDHFSPEAPCTRGQVVTFLWRAAGCPEATFFTVDYYLDVSEDAYYYKAILWAVENKITNGTAYRIFAPEDPCTRGQIVTFLYRDAHY